MAAAAQYQFKQNMEEYREFVEDLSSWQRDLKAKEKSRDLRDAAQTAAVPPVRGGCTKVSADAVPDARGVHSRSSGVPVSKAPGPAAADKPARIKSSDYRAWDQFDVDKAIEEIDAETVFGSKGMKQIKEEYELAEQQRKQASLAEQEETAMLEKEKGNAYFKRGNFLKAVSHYTKSMAVDPRNPVVPCNRGLAYLKLGRWSQAEEDCTSALALDPKNVKALWRRGIARREAGKLSLAREDLEKARVLDPGNKEVKEELAKINTALKPAPPPPRRVPIEEVDTDPESETKEEEEKRWGKKKRQGARTRPATAAPAPAPAAKQQQRRPPDLAQEADGNTILTRNAESSFFDMKPISTRRLDRAR